MVILTKIKERKDRLIYVFKNSLLFLYTLKKVQSILNKLKLLFLLFSHRKLENIRKF